MIRQSQARCHSLKNVTQTDTARGAGVQKATGAQNNVTIISRMHFLNIFSCILRELLFGRSELSAYEKCESQKQRKKNRKYLRSDSFHRKSICQFSLHDLMGSINVAIGKIVVSRPITYWCLANQHKQPLTSRLASVKACVILIMIRTPGPSSIYLHERISGTTQRRRTCPPDPGHGNISTATQASF